MSEDKKEQPAPNLPAPPVPAPKKATLEEIAQLKVQKLLVKYNAKAVMDQETGEALQDFINTVMPTIKEQSDTIKTQDVRIKELEAVVAGMVKKEKKEQKI